ncbi:MAG TPA: HD domain-containing protein [Pirellulales bacterium]|nr:HD domain-containing protein [Pirellulales bacterium]
MAQDKLRQQIASEAARLMYDCRESFHRAKMHAVQRLAGKWVHPRRLPSNSEIRAEIEKLARWHDEHDARLLPVVRELDPFELYRGLLMPLEHVRLSPQHHPEGDALYHSLQVFALARAELPYDEEFLLAALLHDVGKGIDPHNAVVAAVEALSDIATPRCLWLIEHKREARALHEGSLGQRARRRLEESEYFEELMLLDQCDRKGRVPGAVVPELEEALDYVRALSEMCGD